jgi:hypothetical protein
MITLSSNGSTQTLKCSKYPISLSGEFAVSEAFLIHRYSDFNSSHKHMNTVHYQKQGFVTCILLANIKKV